MHPVSFLNINHDVTDLVNHGVVKNAKTWMSWELNISFLRNKKIINLCLISFVAEVTFKALPCNMPFLFFCRYGLTTRHFDSLIIFNTKASSEIFWSKIPAKVYNRVFKSFRMMLAQISTKSTKNDSVERILIF